MKRTAQAKVAHFFEEVPLRLHFRTDLHLVRKSWHMFMGLLIASVYWAGVSQSAALVILGSALGLDLLIEASRLRNPHLNQKVVRLWGAFMRSHEVRQMSTVPHYLASVILAIGIFPKPVAVLSILYLACGDPIASLFGILYGHLGPKIGRGKSLIGTLAGIITCALISLLYLFSLHIPDGKLIALSVVGGLAGGMAELLPCDVDDNFTIPVISGFVMWLAFMIAGI